MIGIDTNVIVRYIVRDHTGQTEIATYFIESNCSDQNPGYLNQIVLSELVWVLEGGYNYSKSQIINVISQILDTSELQVENSTLVKKALLEYERKTADFSDYLIGHTNLHEGCSCTYTFDKKAGKSATFKLLE